MQIQAVFSSCKRRLCQLEQCYYYWWKKIQTIPNVISRLQTVEWNVTSVVLTVSYLFDSLFYFSMVHKSEVAASHLQNQESEMFLISELCYIKGITWIHFQRGFSLWNGFGYLGDLNRKCRNECSTEIGFYGTWLKYPKNYVSVRKTDYGSSISGGEIKQCFNRV